MLVVVMVVVMLVMMTMIMLMAMQVEYTDFVDEKKKKLVEKKIPRSRLRLAPEKAEKGCVPPRALRRLRRL